MKINLILILASICLGIAATYGSNDPHRENPLDVGERVPSVVVNKIDGIEIDLARQINGHKAVIVFYRGGWCPYCNTHLAALGELEAKIQEAGYTIYALSPDRIEKVAEASEAAEFGYTLLSDASGAAARAFGLAFTVDDESFARLQGFGIDIEEASGEAHRELPVPAVYLVDKAGKIVFRHYDPNYRMRLSNEDLLEAINAH